MILHGDTGVGWQAWLGRYDLPDSPLTRRLALVRRLIGRWLDRSAPRPVRVLSVCAGDGRDILPVLAGRRGNSRVGVTLLDQDARLCKRARTCAVEAGLPAGDARAVDAGGSDAYVDLGRFDLILIVGLFGNIGDDEVRAVIEHLPSLCSPGATVIWSRRPKGDLLDVIGRWFADNDFVETFATRDQRQFHVREHQFAGAASEAVRGVAPGEKLFTFVF